MTGIFKIMMRDGAEIEIFPDGRVTGIDGDFSISNSIQATIDYLLAHIPDDKRAFVADFIEQKFSTQRPKSRIVCDRGDEQIAQRLMTALRKEAGEDMFIEVTGRGGGTFDISMCDGVFRFPTYCVNATDGTFNRVSPEEFARTLMGSGT